MTVSPSQVRAPGLAPGLFCLTHTRVRTSTSLLSSNYRGVFRASLNLECGQLNWSDAVHRENGQMLGHGNVVGSVLCPDTLNEQVAQKRTEHASGGPFHL